MWFEDGAWKLNSDKQSVHSLFATQVETTEYIRSLKEGVDLLWMASGHDRRVIAFRAGAFCAQPGEHLLLALAVNGILIDSSTVKSLIRDDHVHLDFRVAPAARRHWKVSPDVTREDASGALLEIPIYSRMERRIQQMTPSSGEHSHMKINNIRRVEFLGCPLDLMTTGELLKELWQVVASRGQASVIQFTNANKIAQVDLDPEMGEIMRRADYVLADGMPLLPMGKMLGVRIPERIDGIGLMTRLLGWAEENGFSVFFLGAKQEVLEACAAKLQERHPKLKVAGMRNGYFKAPEAAGVAAQIRETRADIVFLGMGSPMKEKFADEQAEAMGVSVIQGVGGSFDVMAGVVKRAPVWLQKMGMEWLFRIVQEPRRMFWRYAVTNFHCLRLFAEALWRRWTDGSGKATPGVAETGNLTKPPGAYPG